MKNFNYNTMRNGVILVVFLICSFYFQGCNNTKPKEEIITAQIQEEQNDVQYKKYEDYTFDEFCMLPHEVQYSLKFPNDVDTIITVEYGWIDTIVSEDGTPLKVEKSTRNCSLVLEKDTMKLYYPYYAKPTLDFSTKDKLYDKRTKEFSDRFTFEFKYNKNKKYYYIVKSDLPSGVAFDHEPFTITQPWIHGLCPIDKKKPNLKYELDPQLYAFDESHYFESRYGEHRIVWMCEENSISKLDNWLNGK